jgi:hypothetical protein
MNQPNQFPSLEKFQSALQARSSLLEAPVDEELLSSLTPAPYDVLQRALDTDGAKESDIHNFIKSLKSVKVDDADLLTKDGLLYLVNLVWKLSFEVRPMLPSIASF